MLDFLWGLVLIIYLDSPKDFGGYRMSLYIYICIYMYAHNEYLQAGTGIFLAQCMKTTL